VPVYRVFNKSRVFKPFFGQNLSFFVAPEKYSGFIQQAKNYVPLRQNCKAACGSSFKFSVFSIQIDGIL